MTKTEKGESRLVALFAAPFRAAWRNDTADEAHGTKSVPAQQQKPTNQPRSHVGICLLSDPLSGEKRPYLLDKDRRLIGELTALPPLDKKQEYGSFMFPHDSLVVGQSRNLYTVTPVDLLFWLLTKKNLASETEKRQWQPLDQVLDAEFSNDSMLRDFVDRTHLKHLYESYGDESDGDECFYKFSVKSALEWLTKKQKTVEGVLKKQAENRPTNGQTASTAGGAFSEKFSLAVEQESAENKEEVKRQGEREVAKRCQEESVQIVCNYLSEAWQERFCEHLQLSTNVLLSEAQRRKRRRSSEEATNEKKQAATSLPPPAAVGADWNEMITMGTSGVQGPAKKAKTETKLSAAAKKLAKVNKKGMKKLSSFFAAKKKK